MAMTAATTGVRRCYLWRWPLLLMMVITATPGGRRCYLRRWPLLLTAAGVGALLLPTVVASATDGGGRCCYRRGPLLPPTAGGGCCFYLRRWPLLPPAAGAAATYVGSICYHRRRALLQPAVAFATTGGELLPAVVVGDARCQAWTAGLPDGSIHTTIRSNYVHRTQHPAA
jgi:hypothetical protein